MVSGDLFFIEGRYRQQDLSADLSAINSPFIVLYRGKCPDEQSIQERWHDFPNSKNLGNYSSNAMPPVEANAIANWLFQSEGRQGEKINSFNDDGWIHRLSKIYGIQGDLKFSQGVINNDAIVDFCPINSVHSVK